MFPDGFRCWAEDLWDGLFRRSSYDPLNRRARWRWTLRSACCGMGLHYPIRLGEHSYSQYEPPEPCWACDFCGYERLPYRAWLWPLTDRIRGAIWTLRHPRKAREWRKEFKA